MTGSMRNQETNTRYQRLFTVLYEATRMMNSGVEFRILLKHLATEVIKLVDATTCTIMLLDDEQTELLCRAASGLDACEEASLSFRMGEGISGWVAAHGVAALVPDVSRDPRFVRVKAPNVDISSMLCVPIKNNQEVIGVLTVTSASTDAFSEDDEETLSSLCNAVVQDFQSARLYQLSITDPLTRVFNRQYLFHRLPEEIERCRRYGNSLSICIIDIDDFASYLRQNGRNACDHLLKELSRLFQGEIRDIDSIVRYGGEEFLVLLPQTSLPEGRRIAERLKGAVQEARLRGTDENPHVTVSIGIAEYAGASDSEGFIRQADEALFRAKSHGINRVEAYVPMIEEPVSST
jgi:diguanylate cyclase (GGDEF)-like protein